VREISDNIARRFEECLVLRRRKLHLVRGYFESYNNRENLMSRHG